MVLISVAGGNRLRAARSDTTKYRPAAISQRQALSPSWTLGRQEIIGPATDPDTLITGTVQQSMATVETAVHTVTAVAIHLTLLTTPGELVQHSPGKMQAQFLSSQIHVVCLRQAVTHSGTFHPSSIPLSMGLFMTWCTLLPGTIEDSISMPSASAACMAAS